MRIVHFVLAPVILLACLGAELLAATPAGKGVSAGDPRLMAEFKATDTNKDGQLSRAEIDVRVKRMAAGSKQFTPATAKTLTDRYFALADADKSGGISPAEWQGFTRAIASRYDTNHDGVVSLQERQAARAAAVAEAKER